MSTYEQFLGIGGEERMEAMITILMNQRLYTITFGSYSSNFISYLPLVENIINSFGSYLNKNPIGYNLDDRMPKNSLVNTNQSFTANNTLKGEDSTILNEDTINNIIFSTYADPKYGYSIQYASNVGIGKPFSMEDVNPNIIGNLFLLDNSSETTPEPGEAVHVVISAFHKNETERMKRSAYLGSLRTFDTDGMISSINEKFSFFKFFPNYTLLENNAINFKNNPAYTIEYKYFNPAFKSPQQERLIYVILDNYLFIFQYAANPTKYYQHLPIFQKMINSFEFDTDK